MSRWSNINRLRRRRNKQTRCVSIDDDSTHQRERESINISPETYTETPSHMCDDGGVCRAHMQSTTAKTQKEEGNKKTGGRTLENAPASPKGSSSSTSEKPWSGKMLKRRDGKGLVTRQWKGRSEKHVYRRRSLCCNFTGLPPSLRPVPFRRDGTSIPGGRRMPSSDSSPPLGEEGAAGR